MITCVMHITNEDGTEAVYPIESIQFIPKDADLLFTVPMEMSDHDFHECIRVLDKHFGPSRKAVVLRAGDVRVTGLERNAEV